MGPHSYASSTSGTVAGRPDAPPPRMGDHTVASIRAEIYIAEQRVRDAEFELTSARGYLQALHRRHGELVLETEAPSDQI